MFKTFVSPKAFKRPIGIELTFVPRNPDPWHLNPKNYYLFGEIGPSPSGRSWSDLTTNYRKLATDLGVEGAENVYVDPGCVEFPSPILRSWKQTEQWYNDAIGVGDLLDLVPYEKSQEGGCGHIHMGSLDEKLRRQLAIEAWKRPWLSWVFASPNVTRFTASIDTVFARSVKAFDSVFASTEDPILKFDKYIEFYGNSLNTNKGVLKKDIQGVKRHVFDLSSARCALLDICPLHVNADFGSKLSLMCFSEKTVEWRAFDSASTWDEQKAAIMFYQAFVEYSAEQNNGSFLAEIHRLKDTGTPYKPGSIRMKFTRDKNLCINDFRKLISDLGLPWADYSDLIKINLNPAFSFGQRR